MAREREGVDEQGPAEDLDLLAGVSEAVGASEEHRVVESPVQRLRVVASQVEGREVRIGRRDRADVLRAVEAACGVLLVPVERPFGLDEGESADRPPRRKERQLLILKGRKRRFG